MLSHLVCLPPLLGKATLCELTGFKRLCLWIHCKLPHVNFSISCWKVVLCDHCKFPHVNLIMHCCFCLKWEIWEKNKRHWRLVKSSTCQSCSTKQTSVLEYLKLLYMYAFFFLLQLYLICSRIQSYNAYPTFCKCCFKHRSHFLFHFDIIYIKGFSWFKVQNSCYPGKLKWGFHCTNSSWLSRIMEGSRVTNNPKPRLKQKQ
jgi:hypothetical protein